MYETTTSRLKKVTDPKSQDTNYSYFSDDKLAQTTYTNAVIATPSVSFTYDAAYGRVSTMVDGSGTTTYGYHPVSAPPMLGATRLASVDGPLTDDTITYAYDELGRVTNRSINGSSNSVTWTFDTLGRTTSETNLLGTFTYTYDGVTGRVASVTYPDNQTSAYSYYGNLGDRRLETIHHKYPNGDTLSKFDYTYDAVGNVLTWRQQTGTDAVLWSNAFDAADQLTAAVKASTDPSPVILTRYAYAYDSSGNRTVEQINDAVTGATYDNMNRIVSQQASGALRLEGTVSEPATVTVGGKPLTVSAVNRFSGSTTIMSGTTPFTVTATDASGNSASQAFEVDSAGTGRTFTFDANGNMTSDGTRAFDWNARNELVRVTAGNQTTEFSYDGVNRMKLAVQKTDGVVASSSAALWCQGTICEDRDSGSNSVVRRIFSQGFTGSTGSYLFEADHVGSVVAVSSQNGISVAVYSYDPWGRRALATGTDVTDVGFTGLRWREDVSAWQTRYRLMDPSAGRWTTEDPAGKRDGPNLYAYVNNNPMRYVDRTGLIKWSCGITLFSFGTLAGVGIRATCTSDCINGRQLTQSLVGGGLGGSIGLPASYTYSEAPLVDSFAAPTEYTLPGAWIFSGAGLAFGVIGGTYSGITLGGARGDVAPGWEAGIDATIDAFGGTTIPVSSKWSACKCK